MQSFEDRLNTVRNLIQEGDFAKLRAIRQQILSKDVSTEEDQIVLALLDKTLSFSTYLETHAEPSSIRTKLRQDNKALQEKLHKAVETGNKGKIRTLLRGGADPRRVIFWAIETGDIEMLKLLIENSRNKRTALQTAISHIIHKNRLYLLNELKEDINEFKER
jgi:hypothetical protein